MIYEIKKNDYVDDSFYVERCPLYGGPTEIDSCLICKFFVRSFEKDGLSWIECDFEDIMETIVDYREVPAEVEKEKIIVSCPIKGKISLTECAKCDNFDHFWYDHDQKQFLVGCIVESPINEID